MCSKRVFFPFNKQGTCLILKSDLIQVFNPLFSEVAIVCKDFCVKSKF